MRTLLSRVAGVVPDKKSSAAIEIDFAPVSGWDQDSVRLTRAQVEAFMAQVGAREERDLVGLPVLVTLDLEVGRERITFLPRTAEAESPPPMPAMGSIPARTAGPAASSTFTFERPPAAGEGPAQTADPCSPREAPESDLERTLEAESQAELAETAALPAARRYFLYRETYDSPEARVVELTQAEFAALRKVGIYLHDDGCNLAVEPGSPRMAATERLLDRILTRTDAVLSRAEVEALSVAGHVVSCAAY